MTALALSALQGHDKCLDLLIKAGARLDLKDNWGDTALANAMEGNHPKCVALLEAAIAASTRDPNAPITDEDFLRLAQGGDVAGVAKFTAAAENKGRVDTPRHVTVGGGVEGCGRVKKGFCSNDDAFVRWEFGCGVGV